MMTPKDIWRGIRNVVRWAPVIWDDADYDWAFLARIMEYKLRRMSWEFYNCRSLERWYEAAMETYLAAECLKEMLEDEKPTALYRAADDVYADLSEEERRSVFRFADGVTARTRYRFSNLMANIQNWWD